MAATNFPALLLITIFSPILYFLGLAIYNIYFHPLSKYPGPIFAKVSILWWIFYTIRGDSQFKLLELHERYGPVIRVAPNELNFTAPEAWKDIYGHRASGIPENGKDPRENIDDQTAHPSIIFADKTKHGSLRRLLSNGFSDKTLRDQEPVLTKYIDLLISRLLEVCDDGKKPLNMVRWYNYTTFDVIGHLAFDEPFDCLKDSNYHPWVEMIFPQFKFVTYLRAMKRIPTMWKLLLRFMPKSLIDKRNANNQLVREKVLRRKERNPAYTDFFTHLLQAEEKGQLDIADLCVQAQTLVIAGSETTATLLSGATYYLLANPPALAKLVKEVRSSFNTYEDINLAGANELKYMLACLNEAFRLYPPAATAHQRIIAPTQGATIAGCLVPQGTSTGLSQYAAFRTSANFIHPTSFIPERWLGEDPIFANDKLDAVQPFGVGPRNCIGRNLAYIEMRLIMAKLLWTFDIEATEEVKDWADQMIFTTWDKKPLMVKLTPVVR